ncbi:THUMP domain-containing protein [Ceratobasidium sp. AG-Ba]|nr:THUMP domain-containing protein [Ceratobasidium sp. AG-Ba]QRW03873.1 THUMP domain-containing protein [Ceratobasidium sp. AG-Ba]
METSKPSSKRSRETSQPQPSRKRQALSKGQVKNYKAHLGIPTRRTIDGPGIWAMVVKGKEKQAASELYGIIETISDQIWPKPLNDKNEGNDKESDGASEDDEDIEKQLAKELSDISKAKPKDRTERRIAVCPTETTCVIYVSTKPPIDPVRVTLQHMEQVSQTGVSGTRALVRLIPASGICGANMPAIIALAKNVIASSFGNEPKKYKIELRIRSHGVLSKEDIIKEVAKCVPADKGHTVSLTNQDTTILVEVFKGICTISVVPDYDKYKRFNVTEIVKEKHKSASVTESSRVGLSAIAS